MGLRQAVLTRASCIVACGGANGGLWRRATMSAPTTGWSRADARSAASRCSPNDPHLGLTTPSVWYFAALQAPGLDVIGATLPGVPGVVLGRNSRVAWGMTNTGVDQQDLYLERLNPDDAHEYETPTGWQRFGVADRAHQGQGRAGRLISSCASHGTARCSAGSPRSTRASRIRATCSRCAGRRWSPTDRTLPRSVP